MAQGQLHLACLVLFLSPLWLVAAPSIVVQPAGVVMAPGTDAVLTVQATGNGSLTYQWYRGEELLAGETESSLWLRRADPAAAGEYRVAVNATDGAAWSEPAVVQVADAVAGMWQESEFPPLRSRHDNHGGVYLWHHPSERELGVLNGRRRALLVRLHEATGGVDEGFKWDDRLGVPTDVIVRADGSLYVAVICGQKEAATVVRIGADGVWDSTFNAPMFSTGIRYLAMQPDGKLLVTFESDQPIVGPAPGVLVPGQNFIFRLNPDGGLDPGFTPPTTAPRTALRSPPVVDAQGRIYLCGVFTTTTDFTASGIARLSSDGTLDTGYPNWASLPAGVTRDIRAIGLQPDGGLIAVGRFNNFGAGPFVNEIVALRFTAEGNYDPDFQRHSQYSLFADSAPQTDIPRAVNMLPHGGFALVGKGVACFEANGALTPDFVRTTLPRGPGQWLSRSPQSGRYFVPGAGDMAKGGVQVLNTDGSLDTGFQPGVWGHPARNLSAHVLNDGRLLVGGRMNRLGMSPQPGAILHSSAGLLSGAPTPFHDPTRVVYSPMMTVTGWPDGSFVTLLNGRTAPALDSAFNESRRYLPDGSLASPVDGLAGRNITPLPDGSWLAWVSPVVGTVNEQGSAGSRLSQWVRRHTADGQLDHGYHADLTELYRFEYADGAYRADLGVIHHVRAHPAGGALLAVTDRNGELRLIKLAADGARDPGYASPVFATAAAVQDFVNNVPIAMFQTATVVRRQFPHPTLALHVQPDGSVFVTGHFDAPGLPRGIARLNPDGSPSAGFTGEGLGFARPGLLPVGKHLTGDEAGRVYLSGRFDHVNGHPAAGIVRFLADGTLDTGWHPGFAVELDQLQESLLVARHGWLHVLGGARHFGASVPADYLRARLDASGAPIFTQQPTGASVQPGSTLLLTAAAESATALSYQWLHNGVPVSGATVPDYELTAATFADAGDYMLVASSTRGSTASTVVTVSVIPVAPVITRQPENRTVAFTAPIFFSIGATGAPAPHFQWQRRPAGDQEWETLPENGIYLGTATAMLRLTGATLAGNNGDRFRCVVTNSGGSVTSAEAVLNIVSNAAPIKVAAGNQHAAFLRWGGSLWTMGRNTEGQLGDGTGETREYGQPIASDVIGVAAGADLTAFITTDGTLRTHGYNEYGELGTGGSASALEPVAIATQVVQAAAGTRHLVYRRTDGTVWATGWNQHGQLGDGTTTDRASPVAVAGNALALAAGHVHTLILKTDGTLWAAGNNNHGQFGSGNTTASLVPVPVLDDVAAIAAGAYHSLILARDGTLHAAGHNAHGQLGDGSTTDRATPVMVSADVIGFAAGQGHTVFLKADGTAWTTGLNDRGQLGDGTNENRAVPVQIAQEIAAVGAGRFATYLIRRDGTLLACGANDLGQLGDGTTTDRALPAAIESGGIGLPATVAEPTASNSSLLDCVLLNWTAVRGATHYRVWRHTSNQPSAATVIAAPVVGTFFEDWSATAGENYHYWVQPVNGYGDGLLGDAVIGRQGEAPQPPVITLPPASQTVSAGTMVSFTVAAAGTAPLAYQWRRDGSELDGATATTLDLGAVTADHAGTYDVVVSNAAGTVQSVGGVLTVNRLAQTIVFHALPDVLFTASPLPLTATSTSGLAVGFEVVGGPAVITGDQLELLGAGGVTVRATQAGNATWLAAPPVDRTFTVGGNFASWLLDNFTAQQIADVTQAGPNADPDGDGLANLVEYALGLNPQAADLGGLPAVTRSETEWLFLYTRPAARSDVTYTVQSSTNLTTWTDHTASRIVEGATETWRVTIPVSGNPNLFFRLKVTR